MNDGTFAMVIERRVLTHVALRMGDTLYRLKVVFEPTFPRPSLDDPQDARGPETIITFLDDDGHAITQGVGHLVIEQTTPERGAQFGSYPTAVPHCTECFHPHIFHGRQGCTYGPCLCRGFVQQ